MSYLVLLAEADPEVGASLAGGLSREGFRVQTVASGQAALAAVNERPPDVAVVAFDLPDVSGLDVLRSLRGGAATRRLPLVMLATGAREVDMALSFEFGADDFLDNPPGLRELSLRLRALLRRVNDHGTAGPEPANEVSGLRLDPVSGRAWVEGREIQLTLTEYRVLNRLVSHASEIISRESLLEDVWQSQPDLNTRRVDTVIARLRRKLGRVGHQIETVRGHGYRFRTPKGLAGGSSAATSNQLMA